MPDTDRIPLRTTELSTAGQLAQVTRDRDLLRTELGQARAELTDVLHDLQVAVGPSYSAPSSAAVEAVRQISEARTALADALDELKHSRDSDNFRAGVIREHAAELGAAGEVIAVVRDAQERIDRALAGYDTRPEVALNDGTAERDDCERLADALEHAESVLVDNRDRIWRPAPDGVTYHRHPFGRRTRDTLDRQYGPTQTAMLIWLDGQDDEDDEVGRCEHDVSLDECRQCLIDTYGPDAGDSQPAVPAPSPGSGPARVQGSPDRVAQATGWIAAAGIPVIDRDVRAWLDRLGVPVPVGIWPLMTEIRRAVIAAGDAGYAAAPEPIRPADWERRAVDVVREALQAPPFVHPAVRAAAIAVRAIIDAGLAGPGGRCPDCGSTYPRTLPPGEDARCWTCSTEDQTGGLDEPDPADLDAHRPTVTAVLDGIRATREG
ncbi:hypothetical protein ACN267_31260 [Micromonospora sp. WMMD734]|uniref:hypothetical protein n=1 Tax=Micromonospora sp. WMMD734 TaxID=3404129 RepID=UPI003B94073E